MGAVAHCQYPNCLIKPKNVKGLNSDHAHGHCNHRSGCPDCYRGEICHGHNVMMVDIDAYPEWASEDAKEYLSRRPFSKEFLNIVEETTGLRSQS